MPPTASYTISTSNDTGAQGPTGPQGPAGSLPIGNITINSNGAWSSMYSSNVTYSTVPDPNFKVTGDAEFEGDVKIQGRSILKILETIEQRLAILRPDPEKLEHFEALKKAYDNYKMLEALCQLPSKQDENT